LLLDLNELTELFGEVLSLSRRGLFKTERLSSFDFDLDTFFLAPSFLFGGLFE